MSDTPLLFTIAQIAKACGWTPPNARKKMRGIASDGLVVINGAKAKGWKYDSIPSPVIALLAERGPKFGFSTPLQLLQNPPDLSAPVSLKGITQPEIEHASKLMRVLAPLLRDETNDAEVARIAGPKYARELEGEASDRHLRRLIKRTRDRDGG